MVDEMIMTSPSKTILEGPLVEKCNMPWNANLKE
jgi:hypothetical protein